MTSAPAAGRRWFRVVPDLVCAGWVVAMAVAILVPALVHGGALGPFNYLGTYGLSYRPGAAIHTSLESDQITQMIPWSTLAWTQVHQGHLPLWNPYSALGTPLAFNWQSAAFSLPSLVGYLFPLHIAYTAQVLCTMVVAGSGAYVLGRVLGLRPLACALAGVVFELSGPFFGWLGWPIASVLSWSGWIFAGLVLVVRGGHRVRNIVLLAVSGALAVYAGQPDTLVLVGLVAVVFAGVLVVQTLPVLGGAGWRARPVVDVVVAGAAAAALSAPLLLPGAQLIAGSVRSRGGGVLNGEQPVSPHDLVNLFVGFDGVPFALVAGVGAIAVGLAVTAVVLRRSEPAVIALAAAGVVSAALSTLQPVITLMTSLPLVHAVRWPRAMSCLLFVVAVLAGMGLDRLLGPPAGDRDARTVHERWWVAAGLGTLLVAVVTLALVGPALPVLPPVIQSPLPGHFRSRTLLLEALDAAVAVLVVLALARARRWSPGAPPPAWRQPARLAGAALLVCQSAFLVAGGYFLWSSSSSFLTLTAAEASLQRTVGSALVGLGPGTCLQPPGLGVLPNVNSMLGLRQMAVYDPMLQRTYFSSWRALTGEPGGVPAISTFCPAVTTAALARRFGIGYVLTVHGGAPPAGGRLVRTLGHGGAAEDLYRIPGASAATLSPAAASGPLPPAGAAGVAVPVRTPTPSTWRVTTDATTTTVLRLRLTAAPGWSATVDGRSLALARYSGVMLQARVPAGHHLVVLHYLPATFTAGLVLAALAVLGLALASLMARRRPPGA